MQFSSNFGEYVFQLHCDDKSVLVEFFLVWLLGFQYKYREGQKVSVLFLTALSCCDGG